MSNDNQLSGLVDLANNEASELQQLISNYKKSPKDRLTWTYVNNYLTKITNSWQKFQQLDHRLRSELPEDHAYFNEDVYGKLEELYKTVEIKMISELSVLSNTNIKGLASGSISNNATGISNAAETMQSQSIESSASVELVRQQQLINNVFSLIDQALQSSTQPVHFYSIKLQAIQQHWKNINHLHEKMLESSASYDLENFFAAEDKFNEGSSKIQDHILRLTQGQPSTTFTEKHVKLPTVELPKFDGSNLKCRQFRDLFLELIHGQQLPDCQKMWYLKTSLKGEADQLLQHLSATAENYTTEWKILEDRYENRRMLINAVLTRLINQPNFLSENVNSIKVLHDTTQECLLSLKNLEINTEEWNPILLFLLTQKLSKGLHTDWEKSLDNPRNVPSISEFLDFLNLRFQSLENVITRHSPENDRKQVHYKSLSVTASGSQCIACKQDHLLYKCQEFLRLTPKQRLNLVQQSHGCVNCLKKGHKSKNCTSSTCLKCHKKHNTLLHLEEKATAPATPKNSDSAKGPASLIATENPDCKTKALLSTVRIFVNNKWGEQVKCRALLDSGSQINLVSRQFVQQLGLNKKGSSLQIEGIGNAQRHTMGRINLTITSTQTKYTSSIEAHILPTIVSTQPSHIIQTNNWHIPKNINLADPDFNQPGAIDMLLGVGIFYQLLSVGQITLGKDMPVLQNSMLGWLIGGQYTEGYNMQSPKFCGILTETTTLEEKLQQFWELEECATKGDTFTAAERRCEHYYNQTTRRSADGRYVVKPAAHRTLWALALTRRTVK